MNYITIIVTTLIALLGLFLQTEKNDKHPDKLAKRLTPGGWILLILLFLSSTIALYTTHEAGIAADKKRQDDSVKHHSEIKRLEDLDSSQKSLFERQTEFLRASSDSSARRADEAGMRLAALQKESIHISSSVKKSIDRVDDFELQVQYRFNMKEAGFREETFRKMKDFYFLRAKFHNHENGKLTYALYSGMLGGEADNSEQELFNDISLGLHNIREFRGPSLYICNKNNVTDLRALVDRNTTYSFVVVQTEDDKLSEGIAIYQLNNPRLMLTFPPSHVVTSKEYWFIPDKDSDTTDMFLTWRYRLRSKPYKSLRLLADYENAEVVLVANRIKPDYDSSPSLVSTDEPFGEVTRVRLHVQGLEFEWEKGVSKPDLKYVRKASKHRKRQYVGQLIELEKKNP